MASAALLFFFSVSAILFLLLHAPAPGLANLLASALYRFLDGRGLLELATRRNMILLCHAILFLILRDAGLLAGGGEPASCRRSRSLPGGEAAATATAAAAAVVVAQNACAVVPVPARTHATRTAVVWRRRPRNRAVAAAGRVVVECRPAAELAATWAAPVLATGPPAQEATKQMVLAESSPRNDDGLPDRHDRAAVVVEPLEHPTAIAEDGERDDRRTVAVAHDDEKRTDDDTEREQPTAGLEMELADDRTFEEFIESQRRKMRQESLQLLSSASASAYHYQYQAIATR